MNLTNNKTLLAAVAAATVTVSAQANSLKGYIWENIDSTNAQLPVGALNTANDTFTAAAGPLAFTSIAGGNNAANYTIGKFLATGGVTLATGTGANNTLNNTLFYITGDVTLTHGTTYQITHDDGLSFYVNGTVQISDPEPTSPDTSSFTWNGTSGTYGFQLVYGENHGAPAVLSTSSNLVLGVPDNGSTLGLLGLGLVGVVALRRRN